MKLFSRPDRRVGQFAMVFPGGKNSSVSSAALRKIGEAKKEGKGQAGSVDLAWQSRAYELMDEIGELGYLLHLKAAVASKCLLGVQYLTDDGDWDALPDGEMRPARVMSAFIGPYGGQTELKRRAFLHLSAAGESYLLGVPGEEAETGILWEFLSTDEIRIDGNGKAVRRRDGKTQEQLTDESYLARLWRPNARYSDMADSEVRRVLQICEEIVTLTTMVDAVAKSRLAAGILFVPDEMTFANQPAPGEETEEDDLDPFTKLLMEHMSAPVEDRASAASLVPLVLRGPAAMADAIKLIDIARNLDTWAQSLRAEALERLSQGLDTPPEMIAGKSGMNHWGSYNVDVDFVVKHIIPTGMLLAEFLTATYLRPMLEEFEGMSPEESMRYKVEFDPAPIMARQDEAAAATRLYPDYLISDESILRSNGFDVSDMPDDAEKVVRQKWDLIMSNPGLFAPVLLNDIPGFEDVDVSKLGTPTEDPAAGADAATGEISDATSDQDEPSTSPVPTELPDVPAFRSLVIQLATASDGALDRALERAGAKFITKASRDPDMREQLKSVPKDQVLTLVSSGQLVKYEVTNEFLLDDAWDQLGRRSREWVRGFLATECGNELQADDIAVLVSSSLCQAMQEFTIQHMHEGFRKRNGFRIPLELVLKALQPAHAVVR